MNQLPDNWVTSERGNTWLCTESGMHIAWFKVPGDNRLEVAVEPENYPGFRLRMLPDDRSTDAYLARHINENLVGWIVRKCNIDGVQTRTDKRGREVIGVEDETEA